MSTFDGTKSLLMVRLAKLFHAGFTGTKWELAEAVFTTHKNIESYIHHLKSTGLARVVAWEKRIGAGAQYIARYGWGGGEVDAPKPLKPKGMKFDAWQSENALLILDRLQAAGPQTTSDVAAYMGCGHEYARMCLRQMHKQGMAHIARWDRVGAHPPKIVYGAGAGDDARKPAVLTRLQSTRRRKRRLTEQFGEDRAKSIMTSRADGGPDRIVIDGRVAYERGKPRGAPRKAA